MRLIYLFSCCSILIAGPASSGTLFSDQMNSGAGWSTNANTADVAATFGYDYSADDIPEAPNSQAGDTSTTGLKLEANLANGAAATVMAFPTGQSFSGSYQLRFDAWMNYDANERINGGSAGTTEFIGGNVGYDGVATDVATVGVSAIATGDGGSGSDWRAFDGTYFLAGAEMTGGDRNGFAPYYSDFLPGVAPPAGQAQVSYPPGVAGSPGFQWVTWVFTVINDGTDHSIALDIEKPDHSQLRIFDRDCAVTGCNTDGNIGLFYADFFTSVTSRPDLTFGLVDNVHVAEYAPPSATVPLPAGGVLLLSAFGLMPLMRRRGARKAAS